MTAIDALVFTTYDPPAHTPIGQLTLVAGDQGLRAILWSNDTDGSRERARVAWDGAIEGSLPILDRTIEQLDAYFNGSLRHFDVPLDPAGTEFQVQVWHALANVPYGETTTYGKQSADLGNPRAIRAVASANGRNPLSIILPCHRIIGADGSLTGFAAGLEAKAWLLDHEAKHAHGTPQYQAESLPGM
ncbi:MAG: methylated-DNA-[protein]-cysteine S-methyltransferase [Acidimicrobiales bacterium]|jgi:methylated-DNA-[protein]-cysteine S-methyltransferase